MLLRLVVLRQHPCLSSIFIINSLQRYIPRLDYCCSFRLRETAVVLYRWRVFTPAQRNIRSVQWCGACARFFLCCVESLQVVAATIDLMEEENQDEPQARGNGGTRRILVTAINNASSNKIGASAPKAWQRRVYSQHRHTHTSTSLSDRETM